MEHFGLTRAVMRLGEEALPTAQSVAVAIGPRMYRDHTPGGTISIGLFARDTIGVLYATEYIPIAATPFGRAPTRGPLELRYYVNLYAVDGRFLGSVRVLPGLRVTASAFGMADHELYVGTASPYPRVLQLTLSGHPRNGTSGSVR